VLTHVPVLRADRIGHGDGNVRSSAVSSPTRWVAAAGLVRYPREVTKRSLV
jgi:hypothetical protein